MDFVKKWWLWILLTIIVLVLGGVHLFVTAGYVAKANESNNQLKALKKDIERYEKAVQERRLPTKGDLDQAEEHFQQIRAEEKRTTEAWSQATAGFDKRHEKDPFNEYARYLHERCEESALALARALAPYASPAVIDAYLLADETSPRIPEERAAAAIERGLRLCDMSTHQLSRLDVNYTTVEMTLPSWRRFLILERLHRLAAGIRVEIDGHLVVPGAEGEGAELTYVKGKQTRAVEYLGKVTFSPRIPASVDPKEEVGPTGAGLAAASTAAPVASRGRSREAASAATPAPVPEAVSGTGAPADPEGGVTYHDRYPFRLEMVGHIRVVQEFMKKLIEAGATGQEDAMLFTPVSVTIERIPDNLSSPQASPVMENGRPTYDPANRYDREAPVRAILEYEAYHFRPFAEAAAAPAPAQP